MRELINCSAPAQVSFDKSDSLNILNDPRIFGWLVSTDLKTAIITITLSERSTQSEREVLIKDIESTLSKYQFAEFYMAGIAYTEIHFLQTLKKWTPIGIGLPSTITCSPDSSQ